MIEFIKYHHGSLFLIVFGTLYFVLGLPLVYKKIKRNWFYGFRIRYTLKDDEIWYKTNEMLGKHMVVMGITFIVIGLPTIFLVKGIEKQLIVLLAGLVILLIQSIYSIVKGIKMMNKMAKNKGLKK